MRITRKTKSGNVQTTNIEQMFSVKLLANWAVTCRLLHYVLDMPNTSEQWHYIVINGCKLLKIFQRVLTDIQYPNLDINNYFYECMKNTVLFIKRETL